jgi:hypothetical protein
MKKKFVYAAGLVLTTLGLITFVDHFTNPVEAQSILKSHGANSFGDLTAISLNVTPEDNPTNVATWWDNTGTNFLRVNPTNCQLQFMNTGTLVSAVMSTNITSAITNGLIKSLNFRNGLLIGIQ